MEVTLTHDRLIIGGRRRIQTRYCCRCGAREFKVDPGGTRIVPLDRTQPPS